MTNREWLNSLSDKDLAHWLCNSLYDENLSQIFGTPTYIGVDTVKLSYSHSLLGLKKWLAEEHNGTNT